MPGRFKMILNDESISNERNDVCVRFHAIVQDTGSEYMPETSDFNDT